MQYCQLLWRKNKHLISLGKKINAFGPREGPYKKTYGPTSLLSVMTSGVDDKCYKLQALNLILLLWDQFKLLPPPEVDPCVHRVIALVSGYIFCATRMAWGVWPITAKTFCKQTSQVCRETFPWQPKPYKYKAARCRHHSIAIIIRHWLTHGLNWTHSSNGAVAFDRHSTVSIDNTCEEGKSVQFSLNLMEITLQCLFSLNNL
jgi:hypothetical protein